MRRTRVGPGGAPGSGVVVTDVAVVGGGAVGLAVAAEVARRHRGLRVVVLEAGTRVAGEASTRNSGVIHAGFYYSPDSLKAQLTAAGNRALVALCERHGVPVLACGKVVVATSDAEDARLDELYRRGVANGVPVELVDGCDLARIEPMAVTWNRALFSPSTAAADPVAVAGALAGEAERAGVRVVLGARVTSATGSSAATRLATTAGSVEARHVINAAGLYADRVASWFGMRGSFVVLPFRGLYREAGPGVVRLRTHVYPVPDLRNPFLGTHLTVHPGGVVTVGPTATPALWRRAYGGWAGLRAAEGWEVVSSLRGYARVVSAGQHRLGALVATEVPKWFAPVLVADARRLVPGIHARQFTHRGRVGVRAQLVDLASGTLVDDFVVRGDERSTHVLNAVSPAWTSCLAIAATVVDGVGGGALG